MNPIPDVLALLPALLALVGIVLASVAGIRRTWPGLDGWRAVVAVVVVSLALCVSLAAYRTPALWWQGAILGVLVSVLALGGDSYLLRLAGKARPEAVPLSGGAVPDVIPPPPPMPKVIITEVPK
jgi:hypothetical protein